jgi:predicted O-linked N-acetylglucosamine transferase (SPINDLY family)
MVVSVSMRQLSGFVQSCYERLRAYLRKDTVSDILHQPEQRISDSESGGTIQSEFEGALACHQQGKLDEAESIYRSILQRQPKQPDALHFLGVVQAQRENLGEAAELIGRAIEIDPDNAAAHSNYGNVLRGLKRSEEALASYDRALALNADSAEALNNRGTMLRDLGRIEDALVSYERALTINPDYVDALNNCGAVLIDLKRYEDALACGDRALKLRPNNADAFANRGAALRHLRRNEEALASYDSAAAILPDRPAVLFTRGDILGSLKRHAEAVQVFAKLLEVEPDYDFAKGYFLHNKMLCCDWSDLRGLLLDIDRDVRSGKKSIDPFSYMGVSTSAQDLKRCARIFATEKFPPLNAAPLNGKSRGNTKIRIGYVSGEFRHQATSILMARLFELHDKSRFELLAFDNGWDDGSEIRTRLENAFDEFVDVTRLGDLDATRMIQDRGVDILVNLNGYFGRARPGVFSYRASPIQVSYLGFPGTMGAEYIDYVIGDANVIPPGHEAYYTEKVVRLPDTYQVNDSKRVISERTPTRAEVGLPESGFVFCCFNNNFKITPDIFDIWMRLLKKVEGSALWLLEGNVTASSNLRHEAELRGVSPDRLVFAPHMDLSEHLARHRLAHLFLDTLPCNAHTTASDALWAGLPVLTCMGNSFPGRVAASLLRAVGLPELITENLTEYEALAFRLATTPAMLGELKAKLARNRGTHPLFDTDRFRRHIESAYTTMYERYQRGEPPQNFSVQVIHP